MTRGGGTTPDGRGRGGIRLRAFLLLVALVPIGLMLKLYGGPARWWINNWVASFAYELFFMTLVLGVAGRAARLKTIAVTVCLATCLLEFLQLWKPPVLQAVRGTFLGRSLLGNAFSWKDMPAYPLGCLLGWAILDRLAPLDEPPPRMKQSEVSGPARGRTKDRGEVAPPGSER